MSNQNHDLDIMRRPVRCKLDYKGIIELRLINMLHEADRSINAPRTRAIQQPKKIYIHGNLPNHEHVQKWTRGKYHRKGTK